MLASKGLATLGCSPGALLRHLVTDNGLNHSHSLNYLDVRHPEMTDTPQNMAKFKTAKENGKKRRRKNPSNDKNSSHVPPEGEDMGLENQAN